MTQAREEGRAEDFHDWRKQLKYLRHQFGLLRQVWPDVLGGRLYAEKPSALRQRLGRLWDAAA